MFEEGEMIKKKGKLLKRKKGLMGNGEGTILAQRVQGGGCIMGVGKEKGMEEESDRSVRKERREVDMTEERRGTGEVEGENREEGREGEKTE